jgi:hypothetical protein
VPSPIDRHLALLHALEKRRLRPRRVPCGGERRRR